MDERGHARHPMQVAAFHASGLRIRPSKWSVGDPPDLVQFAFVGKRGAVKAEATMNREAAEFYWEKLGRLLGKDVGTVETGRDRGGKEEANA